MSRIGIEKVSILSVNSSGANQCVDSVAVEEPLEIKAAFQMGSERVVTTISITMRTPGNDDELAAGFLFTEGVICSLSQIGDLLCLGDNKLTPEVNNVVTINLASGVRVDLMRMERHVYTSSSCGVCGKTSLEAVETTSLCPVIDDDLRIPADVIYGLPSALRDSQSVFDQTGGLHASALFTKSGELLALREDVGRHNALDKLIGYYLLADKIPLNDRVLMLSGRASFELVQKAVMARIPIIAAVGAPSSLAIDLARKFNITLIGFVRNNRFNVYTVPERIDGILNAKSDD